MASTSRPVDQAGQRYVVDSDDDEQETRPVTARLGAPSPTPGPRRTPARQSVKRERSPSFAITSAAPTHLRPRAASSTAVVSAPPTYAPPPTSRAEAMAAKMRQDRLAAEQEQQKRQVTLAASSSSRAGPSKATSTSRTLTSTFSARASRPTASSSARLPSSSSFARPAGSSTMTRSVEDRPSVETDGRSIKVDGSNVARFVAKEAWQAFSQFGDIASLDEVITPKSDLTKVIFVTYSKISSANQAIQAMSDKLFPHRQPAPIALWTNLSNGKPPLSATRVKTRVFDSNTEKWLKGGVITNRKIAAAVRDETEMMEGLEMMEEQTSDEDEPLPEPEPAPRPAKKTRTLSGPTASAKPAVAERPTTAKLAEKPVKKETIVIEIPSSFDDVMKMDEDDAEPAVAAAARPASHSSGSSDTGSSDESDDEGRPSLAELFPDLQSPAVFNVAPLGSELAGPAQAPNDQPLPPTPESNNSDSESSDPSSSGDDGSDGGDGSNDAGSDGSDEFDDENGGARGTGSAPTAADNLHKCRWCEQTFASKTARNKHSNKAHPNSGYQCLECTRLLPTENEREAQKRLHSRTRGDLPGKRGKVCKKSGGLFPNKHEGVHHREKRREANRREREKVKLAKAAAKASGSRPPFTGVRPGRGFGGKFRQANDRRKGNVP